MRIRIGIYLLMFVLAAAGCSNKAQTEKLLTDLNSKEEGDRLKAVRLLQTQNADPDKLVPALIKSLADEHADIRRSAALGLGGLGAKAKSALPDLEKAKSDKDRRVRDAATVAISRIEGKK